MSIIKIEDIAYVCFSAPDLAEMKSFLTDFGLTIAAEDGQRMFARAHGAAPFVHVTELSEEPGFAALGLRAASIDDLHALAKTEDVSVEPLDAPGGGYIVRLTDPDGRRVEVVAGQEKAEPLELVHSEMNSVHERPRVSHVIRIEQGPARVVRLGHCVLDVVDFPTCEAWYKERFGFITSDEIEAAPGVTFGAFMRCDRGDTPTDHHTVFLVQSPKAPGFNHAAFEVADLDELMRGHEHLKAAERHAEWGVGRHILGSQIFDYWRDPWGHTLEHWTDGDLFTRSDGSKKATVEQLMGVQWGPSLPPTFV